MTLDQAEGLAKSLMHQYGLYDYKFEWTQRRKKFSRAGYCSWRKKVISLQPTFVELNYPFFIKHTILHEIAHALRPKHGHNKFWKATAKELGHSGNTYYSKLVKRKATPPEVA